MISKKESSAFVHTYVNGELTLAGKIQIESSKGHFMYGKSYLSNPDAYPLDPLHLPLKNQLFSCDKTKGNGGVFNVFLDAGPDSWGKKLLLTYLDNPPASPLGFLLSANGGGVGALRFTRDVHEVPMDSPHNSITDLSNLISAVGEVERDTVQMPEPLKRLIMDGSSMGGARPKATVLINDRLYLAKFNKIDDLVNQALIEHATLKMAKEVGINVPESRVVDAEGKDVILIERFDRTKDNTPIHYISANTVFPSKVNPDLVGFDSPYSYSNLSAITKQISADPSHDRRELFRRCVYNVLVGNTDDHAKNHGFLKCQDSMLYRLSPAFDIVPQLNNIGIHSLHIGDRGRDGTLVNLISAASYHGLSESDAQQEIKSVQSIVKSWRDIFRDVGVTEADIKRVRNSFLYERKYSDLNHDSDLSP